MSMFAPSDVRQITVHVDNGGCGVPHELGVDPAARKIDCLPCEAWLQSTPSLGWANHPGGVKQTCDEIAQTERDEREAKRVGMANLANQIALAVGGSGLVPAAQAQPQSLVEQILALDPTQKQALLVLLGAVPAPALEAAPTEPITLKFDEQDVVPPEQVDAVLKAAQRRKPRKATAAAAA